MRPAGLSEDEDDDLDGFSFESGVSGPINSLGTLPNGETDAEIGPVNFANHRTAGHSRNLSSLGQRYFDEIDNGYDHLIRFISQEDSDAIRDLVSRDPALLNTQPMSGSLPLNVAVNYCSPEMVKLLLELGASPVSAVPPVTELSQSYHKNQDNMIKCLNILHENGADLNALDNRRMSPIFLAIQNHQNHFVKRLVELGSNIAAHNLVSDQPLHVAALEDNLEAVKILLNNNADKYALNGQGRTPFDISRDEEIKDLLRVELKNREVEKVVETKLDPFAKMSIDEFVLSQMPKKGGRLSGFDCDAISFVSIGGLHRVLDVIVTENVQFGEVLNWNEEKWAEKGIKLKSERKRLVWLATVFHHDPYEVPMGTVRSSFLENNHFDVPDIVMTYFRHLCFMNYSITFVGSFVHDKKWKERKKRKIMQYVLNMNTSIKNLHNLRERLSSLKMTAANFQKQSLTPPDLITRRSKRGRIQYVILTSLAVICMAFMKLKNSFGFPRLSFMPFFKSFLYC